MPSEREHRPTAMRQGLGVIGHAVRSEPRIFAGAVLASAVYGVMTVGSSWALGWATQHAVLPAFRSGHATTATLVTAALLIVGVSVVKAAGVIGRRVLAGIMQYRMQARSRRAVTRQYLRLPLAWHHRHPTGQLLSNASSDTEAAWAPRPTSMFSTWCRNAQRSAASSMSLLVGRPAP